MLRIAMCDDETEAREALYLLLDQELHEESEQIVYEFSTETPAAQLASKASRGDRPSVSGCGNGRNERDGDREEIRTFDQNLLIVFVTGFADYVFDGYKRRRDGLSDEAGEQRKASVASCPGAGEARAGGSGRIYREKYRWNVPFSKERDPVVLQRQKESDACDRPGRVWILRQIRRSGKAA